MDEIGGPPRRKGLLDHFATITDTRQPCKVMYPLGEVLALVVCATISACDDYDDIVLWGNAHLSFLRRLAPYHWGVPCADWLRVVMNRVDPDLFSACFRAFVADMLPGSVDQIAIDGKTSRRSHDRGRGQAALHLVSAYATTHNLVLGQIPVPDKTNEIGAIPVLLRQLGEKGRLKGALVTIDAIGCTPGVTEAIVEAGADYLIATKDNQPTVHAEIERYFADAPAREIDTMSSVGKAHGRIETRRCRLSTVVDWMSGHRVIPAALQGARRHRGDRHDEREQRTHRRRAQMLRLLRQARRPALRHRRPQPLAHRERPPLGAGRHLQGGSVPPAQRSWRQEHGHRQTLRAQPRANRAGAEIHQRKTQARRLGHSLPSINPHSPSALTWTRCPSGLSV